MNRSGNYIQQPTGYKAFVPASLPPKPELAIDSDMQNILSRADRALAKMDGIAHTLPNHNLFIAMYVRKEALLSSQIEGTQASLEDIFEVENGNKPENINDVEEVINYIKALNHGIRRLGDLPMSLRLIKEIHDVLLKGVRGESKYPGEFRRTQNWIGAHGSNLSNASFIPPAPDDMIKAMNDLEVFMHREKGYPALIECALIHYQFETIHPFLDGNGRLGRLLITYYLFWKQIIAKPLLYLSLYFKQNRQEYYDRLNLARTKGDYEQWVTFFLKGLAETAEAGLENVKKIMAMQQSKENLLWQNKLSSPYAVGLLNFLFNVPYVTIKLVAKKLDVSFQSASTLVSQFVKLGILKEISGRKRGQKFIFKDYVAILSEGTE